MDPILRFAAKAYTKAAIEATAIRWKAPVGAWDAPMPIESVKDPAFVLIYFLPKVFSENGFSLAAQLNELWQFGRLGKAGRPMLTFPDGSSYTRFSLSELSGSKTVKKVIENALRDNKEAALLLGDKNARKDPLWEELWTVVDRVRSNNREKKWSEEIGNYRTSLYHPEIRIRDNRAVDELTYAGNREIPHSSPAWQALGNFGVRTYLRGTLVQEEPGTVFLLPRAIAVRIGDVYKFEQKGTKTSVKAQAFRSLLSSVFNKPIETQFLGHWKNTETGDMIVLQDYDFVRYRDIFLKNFNSAQSSGGRRLICEPFLVVSDYKELLLPPDLKILL